jgi:hypothetical protein
MIERLFCFQGTVSESFMLARIQMQLIKNRSFLHIFKIIDKKQGNNVVLTALIRITDLRIRIRIRIRILLFSSVADKMPSKNKCFFKNQSLKIISKTKSENSRNQGFSYFFAG